jgi:membrane fusion protein (multidrug efflux system)
MKDKICFIILGIVTLIFFGFVSCGKEEAESRSIEQIYAEEGVPVKTEQLELQLFDRELTYHAVLTGIAQSSAYAKVEDRVEKIYARVGDYVKEDDVLLTFPMDNPNAQYYQAKVAYENARLAYERMDNLYQTGGISKQQLDNVQASYEVAEANWNAARQTVLVRAPISGYVTRVNVQESDNVKRDAELFTISRMDRMKAKLWVSEKEVGEVVPGLKAYAVWNDLRINGEVIAVDMALNQQNQAFGVMVEFDNPDKILKFDILVDVYIKTYTNPQAIVVDRKNIFGSGDNRYVFVARNGQAEKQPVVLGRQYQSEIEISEGLTAGDVLIVEGQILLEPGRKLNIIE